MANKKGNTSKRVASDVDVRELKINSVVEANKGLIAILSKVRNGVLPEKIKDDVYFGYSRNTSVIEIGDKKPESLLLECFKLIQSSLEVFDETKFSEIVKLVNEILDLRFDFTNLVAALPGQTAFKCCLGEYKIRFTPVNSGDVYRISEIVDPETNSYIFVNDKLSQGTITDFFRLGLAEVKLKTPCLVSKEGVTLLDDKQSLSFIETFPKLVVNGSYYNFTTLIRNYGELFNFVVRESEDRAPFVGKVPHGDKVDFGITESLISVISSTDDIPGMLSAIVNPKPKSKPISTVKLRNKLPIEIEDKLTTALTDLSNLLGDLYNRLDNDSLKAFVEAVYDLSKLKFDYDTRNAIFTWDGVVLHLSDKYGKGVLEIARITTVDGKYATYLNRGVRSYAVSDIIAILLNRTGLNEPCILTNSNRITIPNKLVLSEGVKYTIDHSGISLLSEGDLFMYYYQNDNGWGYCDTSDFIEESF